LGQWRQESEAKNLTLDIAGGWAEDPDPTVRQFAKNLVKGLKQRLKQQTVREEEGRHM
jgi:hypothetical protein